MSGDLPPMRRSSIRSWNWPWTSPQTVTGHLTSCTLDSFVRISLAWKIEVYSYNQKYFKPVRFYLTFTITTLFNSYKYGLPFHITFWHDFLVAVCIPLTVQPSHPILLGMTFHSDPYLMWLYCSNEFYFKLFFKQESQMNDDLINTSFYFS